MKISFEQCGEKIKFKISEYDQKYEEAIKMCFYEYEDNAYVKCFSKDIYNIETIMKYYEKNAQSMFSQLGYQSEIPWEDALFEFIKRVDKYDIDWWLVGSCAACIRGIEMNPHDVDIFVDSADVEKINYIFMDSIIEPIVDTGGWLTKEFGVIFLHARIDIATDPSPILDEPIPVDCGQYARENLEEVLWRGYSIKVPPIQLQINANEQRGRIKRVKLLKDFISK